MEGNRPPYSVLELDKDEHEYLVKLFKAGVEGSEKAFSDIHQIRSDNPLAKYRSILTMAATADKIMHKNFCEKLLSQRPEKETK